MASPPRPPSRARLRTLSRVRSLTTGLLLGTSSVSLLSSAVACDPAPDPPICSTREPTAHAGVIEGGLVEIVVVFDQLEPYDLVQLQPIDEADVEGGRVLERSGYDYVRLIVEPDPGSARISIQATVRCRPTREHNGEESFPDYQILVDLPADAAVGDPLKVEVVRL